MTIPPRICFRHFMFLGLLLWSFGAWAQTCESSIDMDSATQNALTAAGQRYYEMIANGNVASLQQNAIPSVASDFSGIAVTIKDHEKDLSGTHPTTRPPFLLDASGTAPIPHAEFFCGVFGKSGQTANSAVFYLNNLPPGKYGIVIMDATGARTPTAVSLVLQQIGTDWKLGGLYIKETQFAGHDSDWFIAQARQYQQKGQPLNAWIYYIEARNLVSPLPFMSTAVTDKLYDESEKAKPADIPAEGKTMDLTTPSGTFKLIDMFPQAVGSDLDLVAKYQVSSIANTNQTYQDNMAVIKALAAKYPELKNAFAAIVARALDPSGRDYGTLLPVTEIK